VRIDEAFLIKTAFRRVGFGPALPGVSRKKRILCRAATAAVGIDDQIARLLA
jgi:hypothetical protein